jgi:hypothetical protein
MHFGTAAGETAAKGNGLDAMAQLGNLKMMSSKRLS